MTWQVPFIFYLWNFYGIFVGLNLEKIQKLCELNIARRHQQSEHSIVCVVHSRLISDIIVWITFVIGFNKIEQKTNWSVFGIQVIKTSFCALHSQFIQQKLLVILKISYNTLITLIGIVQWWYVVQWKIGFLFFYGYTLHTQLLCTECRFTEK